MFFLEPTHLNDMVKRGKDADGEVQLTGGFCGQPSAQVDMRKKMLAAHLTGDFWLPKERILSYAVLLSTYFGPAKHESACSCLHFFSFSPPF